MCNIILGTWSRCRGSRRCFLNPFSFLLWLIVAYHNLFVLSLQPQVKHPEGRKARPYLEALVGRLQLSVWHLAAFRATQEDLRHCKLGQAGMSSLVGEGQPWAEIARRKKLPCLVEFFFIP